MSISATWSRRSGSWIVDDFCGLIDKCCFAHSACQCQVRLLVVLNIELKSIDTRLFIHDFMYAMYNCLRRDVLFTPNGCSHSAGFSVNGDNSRLVTARPFDWCYVEAQDISILMSAFNVYYRPVSICSELHENLSYLERGNDGKLHKHRHFSCKPCRPHHTGPKQSMEYPPMVLKPSRSQT